MAASVGYQTKGSLENSSATQSQTISFASVAKDVKLTGGKISALYQTVNFV